MTQTTDKVSAVDGQWLALDLEAGEHPRLLALLSGEERRRAARLTFPRDRLRYIAAHGQLRELLARRLGCPAREVCLDRGAFGKPFVAGSSLRFSLSRAEHLAFVVFAHGIEVGCDIAWRRDEWVSEAVLRQTFSRAGLARLEGLAPSERAAAFFTVWTCKEALLKGQGYGLLRPPADIDLGGLPPRTCIAMPGDDVKWTLVSRVANGGLHIAVAARGAGRRVDIGRMPTG